MSDEDKIAMKANFPSLPPAGGALERITADQPYLFAALPKKMEKENPPHITPMMAQYIEIKTANPDCLLFYRMGDFYELFFTDAEQASRALGIALTKRGKHQGQDVPMCGVPVHAADAYLQKLIKLGFHVAVCEQTEDPAEARKRGAKSVVRREVKRLVTAGTLTEDNLLDSKRNNFLLSLALPPRHDQMAGLAWIDISTGGFYIYECPTGDIAAMIARIDPSEILAAHGAIQSEYVPQDIRHSKILSPLTATAFDPASADRRICEFFNIAGSDAFGQFSNAERSAISAALFYVEQTQKGKKPPLAAPKRLIQSDYMLIDAAGRTNLELFRSQSGQSEGSLFSAIDRTLTGAGARTLREWLAAPLTNKSAIIRRLDAVEIFCGNADLRTQIRDHLANMPDIRRSLTRIELGRAGPRDLYHIGKGVTAALDIGKIIKEQLKDNPPGSITRHAADQLQAAPAAFAHQIKHALATPPPVITRDGQFIAAGYDETLDHHRELRDEARKFIGSYQKSCIEETGIRNLKIKHNNLLGWFIEVPANSASIIQNNPQFIHRQTMAGAMRYSTGALAELQEKIVNAGEQALLRELNLFEALCVEVKGKAREIASAADSLAEIDVIAALGQLAMEQNYSRPMIDDSLEFSILAGRHPVVEQAIGKSHGNKFVANNVDLGPNMAPMAPGPGRDTASTAPEEAGNIPANPGQGQKTVNTKEKPDAIGDGGQIWLVTGPNMAGKSTFLRQNALIAIMAQMGSFVPAENAHIGIIDQVFSRVGAADDLARGRSTFMVEMIETASILNQAGRRALIILDEIGRGTATFDGLSIAWATIEHLHEVNCARTLFATHFHELTALEARLARLRNVTVKVKEWADEIIFLHEIADGAADRSYGLHVAKLAGMPAAVVHRAHKILSRLESSKKSKKSSQLPSDTPLSSTANPSSLPDTISMPLRKALADINPDDMTPRDALAELYKLKQLLK